MKHFFCGVIFTLMGFVGFSQQTGAGQLNIKGKVKDEKGNPVIAASVLVPETNAGMSTDSTGSFALTVKPNAVLVVSGMGFKTDTFRVNSSGEFDIVLKSDIKSLKEVEVVSKTNETPIPMAQEQLDNIVVQNMLEQFVSSQNMNVGGMTMSNTTVLNLGQVSGAPIGQSVTTFSTAPSGTLYTGASIPVFNHKEETKGSRYFFDKWVHGSVVDTGNHVIDNKNYLFNYDKIAGDLLLRKDANSVIDIDKGQIKAFVLKDNGERYYFFEKPIFDKTHFALALVKDFKKYSLYKSTRTKFKKSDYKSDGLTESGTPYDEYVDEATYVVVMPGGKEFNVIVFKKKALKEIFSQDAGKVNNYFSDHSDDNVDESFVTGLVNFLNK